MAVTPPTAYCTLCLPMTAAAEAAGQAPPALLLGLPHLPIRPTSNSRSERDEKRALKKRARAAASRPHFKMRFAMCCCQATRPNLRPKERASKARARSFRLGFGPR